MKRIVFQSLLALVLVGGSVASGRAEPLLQLDIEGGTWDSSTETLVVTGPIFTLYAILTPGGGDNIADLLNDFYYISAALTPKTVEPGGTFGSFLFDGVNEDLNGNGILDPGEDLNGNGFLDNLGGGVDAVGTATSPYLVTEDMNYGSPPIDACELGPYSCGGDPGDVGGHDIFDTYFIEFKFGFGGEDVNGNGVLDPGEDLNGNGILDGSTQTYNTQTAGGGESLGGLVPGGSGSYYVAFQVDLTNLYSTYNIHFDLYSTELSKKSNTDVDIKKFAPFSHDAEGTGARPIPEPTSLLLLGSGLLGLGAYFRRRRA